MIREAVISDIPKVIALGDVLRRASLNHYVPVHRPTVFALLNKFIGNPDRLLLVAQHGTELTGFIMFACEPFWWDDPVRGRRYGTDWCFVSQRPGDGKELLERAVAWAWTRPRVIEVTVGTNTPEEIEASKGLYESVGFRPVGNMFYMEHPQIAGGTT